ncbi:hypothetical protein GCM10022631_07400 [Deinococcus rubellus]
MEQLSERDALLGGVPVVKELQRAGGHLWAKQGVSSGRPSLIRFSSAGGKVPVVTRAIQCWPWRS